MVYMAVHSRYNARGNVVSAVYNVRPLFLIALYIVDTTIGSFAVDALYIVDTYLYI